MISLFGRQAEQYECPPFYDGEKVAAREHQWHYHEKPCPELPLVGVMMCFEKDTGVYIIY